MNQSLFEPLSRAGQGTESGTQVNHRWETFANVMQNAPFGIYVVDADFRLSLISAGAQQLFSNTQPLIGRDFAEVLRVIGPEPFASETITRFRRTLATGEVYYARNTTEPGPNIADAKSYDWKIERLTLPDERFGVVCYCYDLTIQKQLQEELRQAEGCLGLASDAAVITERKRRAANQQFIIDLDKRLGGLSEPDEIELAAVGALGQFLKVSRCYFAHVLKNERAIIERVYQSSEITINVVAEYRIAEFITPDALEQLLRGETFVINDVAADERTAQSAKSYAAMQIGAMANVPVFHDGRWVSVITLTDRNPRVWQADELELLREVSARVYPMIERARSEQALRVSEEKYRTLFDSMDEGFCTIQVLFDTEGKPFNYRFLDINPAFIKQADLPDAVGKTMLDFAPEMESYWFEIYGRVATTGESVRFENRAAQLHRWYDVYAFRIGEPAECKVGVLFNDITTRKQAEINLRESKARFDIVKDSTQVGFWFCDLPFDVLVWDNRVKEHFWLPPDAEVTIDTFYEQLHPQDRERTRLAIEESIAKRTQYEIEYRTVASDGSEKWIRAIGRTFYDAQNNPIRFDGVTLDITERKHQEAEIKRLSDYNREVLESITDPFFTLDHEYRFTYMSSQGENLVFRQPGELTGKSIWEEFPELLGTPFEKMCRDAIKENTTSTVSGFYLHHDCWYEVTAYPSPNGVTIYFKDFSEGKRAELNLAFLADLQAEFAPLSTVAEIMRTAGRRLSEYLDLTHCLFVEIDAAAQTATVLHDEHTAGANDLVGIYQLEHFHTAAERETLIDGQVLTINDIRDGKRPVATAEAFAALGIQALITAPFIGENGWEFALSIQCDAMRDWRDDEGELLRELAARIYIRIKRARAEEDLKRRNLQLDLLSQVSQQLIVGEKSEKEILQTVFDRLANTLDTEFYFNFMTSDEPPTLRLATSGGLSEEQKNFFATIRFGQYLCGTVARQGVKRVVENLQTCEFEEAAAMRVAGVKCYAGFPLIAHGQLIGTVAFATCSRENFRPGELRLIQTVCDQVAITVERARAEEKLRESEERFRSLFDSIDEGFVIVELIFDEHNQPLDYRFVRANPAFEKLTGLTNALGKTARETVPDLEEFWFETYGRVALTGEAVRFENEAVPMNRWFEVYASRVGDESSRRVAIVFNNITERKLVEREREENLAREQILRQTAEQSSRLKDEFLATVSHELRTPLNAILGWSSMMQNKVLPPDTRRRADEAIYRSARAQAQLVEDLLDVSRIITGQMRLEPRPVQFANVIKAAASTLRPAADAKSIALEIITDGAPCIINGDAHRLQQVMWNLVSNAVKFTPEGGSVQIVLERTATHARLLVRDTGKGIEPEFLPFVFERFRQEEGSTTRRYGGLGLGLAIVRHLVELHGGTIAAQSAGLGQGTTFIMELPLPATRPDAAKTPLTTLTPSTNGQTSTPRLHGIRVLLTDDEPDTLELLNTALTLEGAEVMLAASAAQAFALLQTWRPDVLVSDIAMPLEDGYALIKKVRALPADAGGAIPAIAMTAYGRNEDRLRVLQSGFQMYLAKPVELLEVVAALSTLARKTPA